MKGTGIILPNMHTNKAGTAGISIPPAKITAPRNSIMGIIETKKSIRYFLNILGLLSAFYTIVAQLFTQRNGKVKGKG
jgi:hypothetical protein